MRQYSFTMKWLPLGIVLLIGFFLYAPSLPYAFVSDDIPNIVKNPFIGTLQEVIRYPTHSLQSLGNFIIYKLFGFKPMYFRSISIIFHLLTVIMIYLLVMRMINRSTAILSALFFTVHPILTESVVWISGVLYLQYTFFCLVSLYCYIRSKERKKWYIWSLGFFILSLLASEKAIVFPLLILAYEWLLGDLKKQWRAVVPFFLILAIGAVFIITLFFTKLTALQKEYYVEGNLYNPLLQIPVSISSYIELILWPQTLSFYHSEMSFTPPQYAWKVCMFFLYAAGVVLTLKRNRMMCFWCLLFLIPLLPTLTPYKIAWVVAERYAYFSTAGMLVCIAFFLDMILRRKSIRPFVYAFVALSLAGLTLRTFIRIRDWQNEETLFIATAKTAPSDPKSHLNMGYIYSLHGENEASIREYMIALQLQPNYAAAYHNMGNTYVQMGEFQKAREQYLTALSLNPNIWETYASLAALSFQDKNFKEAIKYLEKARMLAPYHIEVALNLGIFYKIHGDKEKARELFAWVLDKDPKNQKAQSELLSL